jgi:hypothetical protein
MKDECTMSYRRIIGWAIAFLWWLTLPSWAVEYRFQVTHIERLIFSSYLERSPASPRGQETMQRLETLLDSMEFPSGAVLPGREVPAVSRDFLANAADRGTYVTWLQQHAKLIGGMNLVVGRRHEVFTSTDRVYMLLTLPPGPHTFKVVVGWKDHDDRGSGQQIFENLLWRP